MLTARRIEVDIVVFFEQLGMNFVCLCHEGINSRVFDEVRHGRYHRNRFRD
jgi:hypothetical protein